MTKHAAPRRRVRVTPVRLRMPRLPGATVLLAALGGILFGGSVILLGTDAPPARPASAQVRVVPSPFASPVPHVIGECAEAVDQAGELITQQQQQIADGRQALLNLTNGEWPGEHIAALDTVDQRLSGLRNAFYELEKACHEKVP